MKKMLICSVCLLGTAALALAQTKISGAGKCSKPTTQQTIEVGDRPGHTLLLVQQPCTWTTPLEMAGLKSTTYITAVVSDASAAKYSDHGYVVLTMDNGDKAYVRFTGTGIMKDGQAVSGEGSWSWAGGTGKLRGLTGKGTYKSTGTPEGGEDQVEGDYALPAPKPAKK